MKFKDLVANSLPRVRGRKSKKTAYLHPSNHVPSKQEPEFSTHAPYFMQHQYPVFESRESSVERSSTVAVVDAPWREDAAYTRKAEKSKCDMGLVAQSMTYYTPLTHQQHGMVMSHSADGISTQAMLLASPRDYGTGSKVASLSDHYAISGYQHPNMATASETAVNYVGPNYVYHSRHQHQHQHHHHHHSHDYHYVYHHHHHDGQHCQSQNQPQVIKPDPLTERNSLQSSRSAKPKSIQPGAEISRKSESGGFLRKSFASFRAMRKLGSRNKEKDIRTNSQTDENNKCLVCPHPQSQNIEKNGSHKKQSKQSKKDLKSFMKSKKNKHNFPPHDNLSDASWCSENDMKKHPHNHHLHNMDIVPLSTVNSFSTPDYSRESSMPRQNVAGCRDAKDLHFETNSLSGYDSDVTKNRTSRSRSRIKTNPWLPSPQPSLTMGRRIDRRQSRDDNEDTMDEEISGGFPRSASFDYHSQLGVSTFLSSNGQSENKRAIQRHRSLTPVDLKLQLSLPRSKKTASTQPHDPKGCLNDLNTNLSKSRPNSIVSPNSEFVALADNIEQLANNISFEYEERFDTSLESSASLNRERVLPTGQGKRASEEMINKKRKSDSSPLLHNDNISDNAHSPDSGIGCLGSCDGDDSMTLGNTIVLEQSPTVSIPSSESTKSDSLNSTPKRKTTKNIEKTDGNSKKSTCLSSRSHDCAESFEMKSEGPKRVSSACYSGSKLFRSSSSESVASVVISESDIDNTSYKFVEGNSFINKDSTILVDPHKPQNVTPCLMVDERLDVNFRSLPRKLNGKQAKKRAESDRIHTISRSKNVIVESECTPSLVLYPNDEKSSSLSLTQVTKPQDKISNPTKLGLRSSRDQENIGEIEFSCDGGSLKGNCEMSVNFEDLSTHVFKPETEAAYSDAMDTVDACVQTDFFLDFDNVEKKQLTSLSPLDDNFDPVESTRRWLISGNMQGSADTGYSSQARDSLLFMDEESALLSLETLSNNGGHSSNHSKTKLASNALSSCIGKLSPCGYESPCSCGSFSSRVQLKSESQDLLPRTTSKERERNEPLFSECALRNSLLEDRVTYEIDCGGCNENENSCDSKAQVNKRHNDGRNISISDVNKRHSSDSSTSTLTSDVMVLDKDSDNINCDNSKEIPYALPSSGENQFSHNYNAKKEMTDSDYHDYVNLPVRFLGAKVQSKFSLPQKGNRGFCCVDDFLDEKTIYEENKEKHYQCCRKLKSHGSCISDSQKDQANFDDMNEISTKTIGNDSVSTCLEEIPMFLQDERPDYLEFLRDAPLPKPQSTMSQIFIVPGFGPLEFPTRMACPIQRGSVCCLVNSKDVKEEERTLGNPDNARGLSLPNTTKAIKLKREERPTNLKLLSYNCSHRNDNYNNGQSVISSEQTKKDTKGQPLSTRQCKRKSDKDSLSKSARCPTVQSYDVDDFSNLNRADLTSSISTLGRQDTSGPARNLNERVLLLRREKEAIYRKIQEVQQQQELNRQREQFQQHRNLHSQRKEELLETLRILKDKLEEQSKTLQMKCRDEM